MFAFSSLFSDMQLPAVFPLIQILFLDGYNFTFFVIFVVVIFVVFPHLF